MVTPKHLCPWGVKAKDLLRRAGYQIEDHHLASKEENEDYKQRHGYDETPQIFIGDKRVGGYDALREFLGKGPDPKEGETYQPVIAVFLASLLMALSTCWAMHQSILPIRTMELFVSFSMCVLGILKLRDLQGFATGFIQYDLLAQHYVPYAYVYAFIETGAGILMIGHLATLFAAPAALLVSTIGAVSVFKAVYLEKRDLNCACVGGGSKVPLGFISLTENLLMMAMAVWMLAKSAL
ncbi:glutaredoxin family protein [Luteolibacter ambystomatis]|nr:glutaredoxin [Luteolibacter ambystomatis]